MISLAAWITVSTSALSKLSTTKRPRCAAGTSGAVGGAGGNRGGGSTRGGGSSGAWARGPMEAGGTGGSGAGAGGGGGDTLTAGGDRKSTRLNSSHRTISYAVYCLKKKN